jgi:hypothetical protein
MPEIANARPWINLAIKITGGIVVGIILIVLTFKAIGPQLNLYRANTEKQAVIADQRAQSEAAEFAAKSAVTQAAAKADAMVIEAKGLAESQQIIASTLTPEYIRYLYIKALEGNPNQVIYVPTEAGLPILEAGRGATPVAP